MSAMSDSHLSESGVDNCAGQMSVLQASGPRFHNSGELIELPCLSSDFVGVPPGVPWLCGRSSSFAAAGPSPVVRRVVGDASSGPGRLGPLDGASSPGPALACVPSSSAFLVAPQMVPWLRGLCSRREDGLEKLPSVVALQDHGSLGRGSTCPRRREPGEQCSRRMKPHMAPP